MKPSEDLRRDFLAAHRTGWQIAVHAIGDVAIATALGAYEEAQRTTPRPDTRHRIEHLGYPGPGTIDSLRATRSVHRLYPGRSLLDAGIAVAGSSDGPIGPPSPFVGMAAAVDRRTAQGLVIGPGEALHAAEALDLYAGAGAHAMFHETQRGCLQRGMLADLAVLDDDPTVISPDRVGRLRARMTVARGQIVHGEG